MTGRLVGHRLILTWVGAGALIVSAPNAGSQTGDEPRAPSPVVERLLEVRDRVVRTTLFSNKMVVVSGRRDGEQIFFRQVQLADEEYMGYLAALERDGREIRELNALPRAGGSGGRGTVTLHVGSGNPLQFTYSSMEIQSLAVTRLLGTLDDLEYQVMWHEPTGTRLEGWEPDVGDEVQLRSGVKATVVELRRDGTIVLEHERTYIRQIVPEDQRREVIFEVVVDR